MARLFIWILLLTMLWGWWMMPRVTDKDAVAYAQALFLEYCRTHNLEPHDFIQPPTFHVAGGDQNLIFVYQFRRRHAQKPSEKVLEIQIDRAGKTQVGWTLPAFTDKDR